MRFFDACKSISGIAGANITDRDSYYVGMVLKVPAQKVKVSAFVTDGNGNWLDIVNIVVLLHGQSRAHNVLVPAFASGGISVSVTDSEAEWVVYYAEQYFRGHRRA